MVRTLEQSTMRKVYFRLLPFAVLSYVLAYIDRINVSFAGLTMRGDLDISAGTFGFAVGMFYWGYFIFEVPSNVILQKIGARIWIARIMITWGILAGLTAMVTGPTSFGIVRFLLGVAEAGFFPGIILYFTYWFPSHHHARIVSGFLVGLPVAVAIGAPVPGLRLNRIPMVAHHKIAFIDTHDVLCLESQAHYTRVLTRGGYHFCNLSIGDLQARLDPAQFMRVHRCFIVNLQAVAALERDGAKTLIVLTGKPKALIPVSRVQASGLRKSLGQLVRS